MSPNTEVVDRRTVMKSTSAFLGVLGLGGTVSAAKGDNSSGQPDDDNVRSGSWQPDEDDIKLASNTPGTTQTIDVDYNDLTYIDSLSAGGPIDSDPGGIPLGYADHFLHFYRGDEKDDNGNYLYYLAFWSSGDPEGSAPAVRELSHEVELADNDWNITQWDPDKTYDTNCSDVDLEIGASYNGAYMSMSQTVEVCKGTLEPLSGIDLQNFGFEFHGGFRGAGDGERRYAKGVAMFRAPDLLDENDLQYDIDWSPYAEFVISP